MWTIPAQRMKAGRDHRVPLSRQAVDILRQAERLADGSGLVFPSVRGKVMSDSTMSKLLRDNEVPGVPHGFRSSFRDWCGDREVSGALSEAALAHTIKNKTEAAYARSDLLEPRRPLMQEWADYLS